MATYVYTPSMNLVATGSLGLTGTGSGGIYKMMLVNTSQSANKADSMVVSHLTAVEINAVGYSKSFGGTGRIQVSFAAPAVSGVTVQCSFSVTQISWTTLGGTLNDTIAGVALIKETTAGTDSNSPCIAYWDITPVSTNGSSFTITFSATGNIQFTT